MTQKSKFYTGMLLLIFLLIGVNALGRKLLFSIIDVFHLESVPYAGFYLLLVSIVMLVISFFLLRSIISKKFDVMIWIRIYIAGILVGLAVTWIVNVLSQKLF